jgi:CheY-like chemotaxis protein
VLRVLIADDNKPVAQMLTELVADPGRIEVVGVTDTETGTVEAIRRLRPGAVVLDLTLRTGSGTNVIRAVRADPALAATVILVTSNHVQPQMRAACMELGADGYFDKVKELGEMSARLAELASRPPASR